MRYFVAGFLVALLGTGCSPEVSSPAGTMNENVAKIAVTANGSIKLNGVDSSLDDVRSALVKLSREEGSVWYYRGAAESEPHPNAMLVIEAIAEARVPVSMSTKPDFSDVVLADGTTRPR